ncbi:unnamed protein product [Arctia plantaginis]|uniref:Uncharacterized protein n=1 Tax=Arctia plantaginis TaxID=874455 RepID=A0A8S0Z929_ARCPL|nr:unnamed protein product [Arctia plantaginis]
MIGYVLCNGKQIFLNLQIVYTSSAEERPEKCIAKADLMYRVCCVQPPYFTREVAKECGAGFELLYGDRENNVTGYRRLSYTSCGHWYCVLDKYALITNEGFLDHEKFFAHLDVWVSLNPVFSKTMISAKRLCAQSHRIYFPLKPCEFFNLLMCIRNYVNVECPIIIPTKECREQKAFFRECGQYYVEK